MDHKIGPLGVVLMITFPKDKYGMFVLSKVHPAVRIDWLQNMWDRIINWPLHMKLGCLANLIIASL